MAVRSHNRKNSELRPVHITPQASPYAEGSVIVEFGMTKVLVTASIENEVPKWSRDADAGWVTAEYGMLPRATHTRSKREAASGKQGGRTLEIQRLIGRALRQAVDLKKLGPRTVILDCDVLNADGGTRTAAVTGGWVALALASDWLVKRGAVVESFVVHQLAAVSAGYVQGEARLDLEYVEDSAADFDLNLVFNEQAKLVEVQGTAERHPLGTDELFALTRIAEARLPELFEIQRAALTQGRAG